MKKKIFSVLLLLSMVVIVLASALVTGVYYRFYQDEAKNELRTVAALSTGSGLLNDPQAYSKAVTTIAEIVPYRIRVTIIDQNGQVAFDTDAELGKLENHSDRREFKAAEENGAGEDTRRSESVGTKMYYYAIRMEDGHIIRFSRQLSNIWAVFSSALPLLCVVIIGAVLLALLLARMLTRSIIRPIEKTTRTVDAILNNRPVAEKEQPVYEELAPFASGVKTLREQLNDYIEKLKAERDTISIITQNMNEGLILLDAENFILSVNHSAIHMLGSSYLPNEKRRNLLELTRDQDILDHIFAAQEDRQHTVFDLDGQDGQSYRYFVNPTTGEDGSGNGTLVLIANVTEEKHSEQIRKDFSANVSHELKTPLTTIRGFAEMIGEGMVTEKDSVQKYAELICEESKRLLLLIEDIMRLSEIEETSHSTVEKPVKLDELAAKTCESLQTKANAREVTLTVETEPLSVLGNESYLGELFYNLIDNAIKYNRQGGKVMVSVHRQNSRAIIQVADTGIGIPPEHQSRIFERFYRVDKSRSKETGGTGLGLSIVKHIVEFHQGTLQLQSAPEVGTKITIHLPL